MKVAFAFFAEHAQLTADSRLNVLGLDLHTLQAQTFPLTLPSVCVVVKVILEPTEREGSHKVTAQMIGPDGAKLDPYIETDVVTPPRRDPARQGDFTLALHVSGLTFPSPGVYTFHIWVDGKELDRLEMSIQPPNQAMPAPALTPPAVAASG